MKTKLPRGVKRTRAADGHWTYWEGLRRLPSPSRVFSALGLMNFNIPRSVQQEVFHRGSYVHDATHHYDLGQLDVAAVRADYKPYVDGYLRFVEETRWVTLYAELPVVDDEARSIAIVDKAGLLFGCDDTILEIKTGSEVPEVVRLQLSAQQHALPHQLRRQGFTSRDHWPRRCLWLRGDGSYRLLPRDGPYDNDDGDLATWRALVTSYEWAIKHGCYTPTSAIVPDDDLQLEED